MANSVNLLRNSRKVFPLQNFGNETDDLPKLQKYSVGTAFVSRLCDLNLEFQGRTNNVKKQKLWKIYFRTLLLRFIFSFSFLLSRSANFLSLMKFAVEEAKSELNRIGKRRNVFVLPKKVCSETSALHFLAFIKGRAHQQTETCEKLPDHILSPFLILVSLALYSDNLNSCPKPYICFFYSPRRFSAQNSAIFSLSHLLWLHFTESPTFICRHWNCDKRISKLHVPHFAWNRSKWFVGVCHPLNTSTDFD